MVLGEAKLSLDDSKHPSKCKWFNLSILANFMHALIVLSSITKERDCNEHGTIYAISSDFGDRMTTQSMGLMFLLSEYF